MITLQKNEVSHYGFFSKCDHLPFTIKINYHLFYRLGTGWPAQTHYPALELYWLTKFRFLNISLELVTIFTNFSNKFFNWSQLTNFWFYFELLSTWLLSASIQVIFFMPFLHSRWFAAALFLVHISLFLRPYRE